MVRLGERRSLPSARAGIVWRHRAEPIRSLLRHRSLWVAGPCEIPPFGPVCADIGPLTDSEIAGAAWKDVGAGQETARAWYMTWRNQQLNQAIRARRTPGPDRVSRLCIDVRRHAVPLPPSTELPPVSPPASTTPGAGRSGPVSSPFSFPTADCFVRVSECR